MNANQGGSLCAGMSGLANQKSFKSGSLWSGILAQFGPESVAHFAPEWVAQFGPE